MNFKILFFCFICFFISSCGVKAPPLKPTETVIDSYIGNYTNDDSKEPNKSNQTQIPELEKK